MTYYSPGVEYLCHKCGSDMIRFIFDSYCAELDHITNLIKTKRVALSDSYNVYISEITAPKWICYECYDCGVVLF